MIKQIAQYDKDYFYVDYMNVVCDIAGVRSGNTRLVLYKLLKMADITGKIKLSAQDRKELSTGIFNCKYKAVDIAIRELKKCGVLQGSFGNYKVNRKYFVHELHIPNGFAVAISSIPQTEEEAI